MCRYEHFVRCLESLKKNKWSIYTDVYIGLDYPSDERYMDGYRKISDYLDNDDFSAFASFTVFRREVNYGTGKNMRKLREAVEDKYPYFIRTDDDAEFSVNFLEYINKTLWYFKDDKDAIGVTGYSYPIEWNLKKDSNVFKMNYLCPMWGTAFYFEKFNKLNRIILNNYYENNTERIVEKKIYKNLSVARYVDFAFEALADGDSLVKNTSDVGFGTIMSLVDDDWFIASPKLSKVRNHGFDGTGEYCQDVSKIERDGISALNYDYSKQPIDESEQFDIVVDDTKDYSINRILLDKFDSRDDRVVKKAKFHIFIFAILGRKKYNCLVRLKRRIKGE